MGGEPRAGGRLHVLRGRLISTGMCQTENGAVASAVPMHLRVHPPHFDWRWRERPVLALLAWEARACDPRQGYAASK